MGMKVVAYSSVITYSLFLIIGLFLKNQIIIIYYLVKDYVWVLLAGISFHLILKESSVRKAFLFFALSGILGLFTFNLGLKEPFLPLLTGLFGTSSLIMQKEEGSKIPTQMKKVVVESSFFELIKANLIGIIGSIIMAIVPSMSPSQVGLITEEFKNKKTSDELKISTMTSINISDNLLSLIALISINKGRSGVVEKINDLITLNLNNYYLLLFTGFLACTLSAYLLIKSSKWFSERIHWFDNNKTRILIISFVAFLTLHFNGLTGLLILTISTILGYYCTKNNIRKSQLLGCLVIPTITFYIRLL